MQTMDGDIDVSCAGRGGPVSGGSVLAVDFRGTNYRINLASAQRIQRLLTAQRITRGYKKCELHPGIDVFVKRGQYFIETVNHTTVDKLTDRVLVPPAARRHAEKRAGSSPFADGLAAHSKQRRDLSWLQRSSGSLEQIEFRLQPAQPSRRQRASTRDQPQTRLRLHRTEKHTEIGRLSDRLLDRTGIHVHREGDQTPDAPRQKNAIHRFDDTVSDELSEQLRHRGGIYSKCLFLRGHRPLTSHEFTFLPTIYSVNFGNLIVKIPALHTCPR